MYDLILGNVRRFIHLTAKEEAYFLSLLSPLHLARKAYLVREGQYTKCQYFVNQGCLRTFYVDKKEVEHNVQFAIEDWWTGDMYSLLSRKPARFNVVALEDSDLLAIRQEQLEALYTKVPQFERYFRLLLQHAFVAMQERIFITMSGTAADRYLHFRKKYPEMDKRIPQHQIAAYLGIMPESLSRVRRQLMQRKK